MLELTFLLLPLFLILVFWISTMNSRDAARKCVRLFCDNHGIQLLDQTVALQHLRFTRKASGNLGFVRIFRFDYSDNGFERQDGMIWMRGDQPVRISLRSGDRQILEDLSRDAF